MQVFSASAFSRRGGVTFCCGMAPPRAILGLNACCGGTVGADHGKVSRIFITCVTSAVERTGYILCAVFRDTWDR